ncbi:MAG: DUF1217 domain-containing protein [Verrucomicrobiota bacterium]
MGIGISPGIAAALHFKNTIAHVTDITQLMSDPKLVKVAVGGGKLPSNFSALDYDKQLQLMTKAGLSHMNFGELAE